ncbi:Splicing factor 3a, subunit 2 [Nosema bombycis CQ1]|uniref:Splicing factor 3a, subunit 2 n=1 Tax=Nosema bombycis (strain CQ1 / CVCC 102059) TaxID=578461 RepID=R0M134_NOSB1|nr:Splicing factor 3a, subunit 2 [Nosema bombycis CQ1]|eukprot:EOB11739.1 Splicing factor 3a, subunit 2 [Nosema bombycis CQ1]
MTQILENKFLKTTNNGKLLCTKCNRDFFTPDEFNEHCKSKKHLKNEVKTKEKIKDYKILSLIYNENILGYSFRIKIKSKPKFRILNGIEQCVESYNDDYYLVLRCKDYETSGFRMKGVKEIYEELTQEMYCPEEETYTINLFYKPKI